MEKEITIKVDKNKWMKGVLRGNMRQPLILFVHGMTGTRDEHIFFNGARFFEKHGFATFRFNLYDWVPEARKLKECTLAVHAQDVAAIIAYFREKGVKRIGASGHSYGGLTLLMRQLDLDALVLWDPTYNAARFYKKAQYIPQLKGFYREFAYGIFLGKKMVEEACRLTEKACDILPERITAPLRVINAGKGILIKGGRRYVGHAGGPSSHVIIPNAKHCFDEDGAEEKLFQESLKWYKKYL
jgi:pimeloyl-ACP methyl ester carboxylesterase